MIRDMKILERATRWIGTGILLQGFSNLRPTFEIFSTNYTFMYVYVYIYPTCLERFDAILEIQEGSLTGCASSANQQVL